MSSIIVLPLFGSPYKVEYEGLESLQKQVDGSIEGVPRNYFKIHPMFFEEKAWKMTALLMKTVKNYETYCNSEGMYTCGPNMACIPRMFGSPNMGCIPRMFGKIIIKIKNDTLEDFENKFNFKFPQGNGWD